jgi:FixJ family two-component response regulator
MSDGVVFIVDDEEAVRDSIDLLVRSAAFKTATFASAHEFLATYTPDRPGCLVLDVRMPRMSGLELQQELNRRGWIIPVIFMTGHGDVPMAVSRMKLGAVDFLEKPFDDQQLCRTVAQALENAVGHRSEADQRERNQTLLARLTPRERQVLDLIASGRLNKQIADDLSISIKTVEAHRANIMDKFEVRTMADLMRKFLTARNP